MHVLGVLLLLIVIHADTATAYTAILTSDVTSEELVIPTEAAESAPAYRVFRTLRLQLVSVSGSTTAAPATTSTSAYQFREIAGGYPTELSPPLGVDRGAVAAVTVSQRTSANCSRSVSLKDDTTGIVIDPLASSMTGDNTYRNLYALLAMAQLVPVSPSEAILYFVPSRQIFEALPIPLRVTFVVSPGCLEDVATRTPLSPTTTFAPVNITTRLTPMQAPFSDAQDICVLALVVAGIVLVAPHAAAHAPRMLLGTITRQCLPFPESPVSFFVSPTGDHINVRGIADNPHVRILSWGLFQWWVVSLGVPLVGLIALCVMACTQRRPVPRSSRQEDENAANALCCGAVRQRVSSAFTMLARASCSLRYPNVVVLVTLPTFAYISFTSVALLLSLSDETVALLGVGGMAWILVALMVILLLLIGAFRFVYVPWDHDTHQPPLCIPRRGEGDTTLGGAVTEPEQVTSEPAGARRSAMVSLVLGRGKWEDDNSLDLSDSNEMSSASSALPQDHDTIGSGPYTRSCRLLLQEYDNRGSFFVCVDLLMAAACGGIQGASVAWTASYENCSSLLYGSLAVLGAYWLIAVLRRPFRYGYVSCLNVLITSFEIASVGWELYRGENPSGYTEAIRNDGETSRNDVSNAIVNTGLALVALKMLLDVFVNMYATYRCWCTLRSDHGRGELRRRMAARQRELAAIRDAKDALDMKNFLRTSHMVDEELCALADAIHAMFDLDEEDGGRHEHQIALDWLRRAAEVRLKWSLSGPMEDDVSDVTSAIKTFVAEVRQGTTGAATNHNIAGRRWKLVLRKCDTVLEATELFVTTWNACHTRPACMRREDDDDEQELEDTTSKDLTRALIMPRPKSVRKLLANADRSSSSSGSDDCSSRDALVYEAPSDVAFRLEQIDVEPGDPQDVLLRHASLARINLHFDSGDCSEDGHSDYSPPGLKRFRSSRALLEHVCSETANYAVAPGVSRNVFVQHHSESSKGKRDSRRSQFSPHDTVFTKHLYKFEEI